MSRRKKTDDTYHHGDLRDALLAVAAEVVAERGLQGLSIRECARRVGVSHAAPYRHFADKNALVYALAQQGFAWLAAKGRAAMQGIDDPRERLDAYGAAYARFAFEHPVHHRIMFASEIEVPEGAEKSDAGAFDLLVEAAAAVAGPDQDPELAAVAAWALPHGLAMLVLDGRIPAEKAGTGDQVEALARSLFAMWRGPLGEQAGEVSPR